MKDGGVKALADEPRSVAAVYEDGVIAEGYLQKRLRFSWQRLLHRRQVAVLRDSIRRYRPQSVLEVAPGPARLSAELDGIARGVMVENSASMAAIARARLKQSGREKSWTVLEGDAFGLENVVGPAEFELAYTFRFIRHFHDSDRKRLYAQLRRRLTARGILIFDVVNATVRQQIDARQGGQAAGEIAIYDAVYTPRSFAEEMRDNGFEVVAFEPVLRHFRAQSLLSYKLDDVARWLVAPAVSLLEGIPSSDPLEWVAICRRS